uniref:Retrotransposon protein, putative, unclassified n=1 Tax=Tanacetum cinerariifolium TaxID=118510 RepID=A0A6L2JCC7_TANCI|nr:retrotransposon protein, putative, unclassified [Tanacetum cinerariifolium]
MMKGSDIGIQEKKAKLFNEWERFTSTEGESIESYYHRFLKLMNDLKQNKHFPEKIASNLKFLNNLQPEWSRHVTIVHQTKDLHTTNYTQLYDFLKYNQKEVNELKAEHLVKTQDPLALMTTSNNPYNFLVLNQDQPSFNQNYMQQPMPNLKDITDSTTAMNMTLTLMAKAFKLNYSTPTNNNQRISSNPRNRQIAQPGMNMGQDRHMQMVGGNGENQFRQYAGQNVGNLNGYNTVQNVGNQVVQNAVQNQRIRCYNCRGVGHFARNCTVRPRRRDDAYLQTQLLIAQKEETGIQLRDEEFDLMAAAVDLDEIEEVNANCILMANLQQASTLGTQTDRAPVYDLDGSAEEAAKFVGDFKYFAKEVDESLAKQKALEWEIKHLLKAVKNEYAKLWNDWYKKCEECKFDKIAYDKAYNDMQRKIERLQAQLGDLKGKSKDTSCVSDTLNPLSQKLENENVELECQVIAPGMFRINPFKTSREAKHVPNTVRASARTKLITVSQPPIFTKKDVNSDSNGLSFTGIDNTKTRRPQPRSNIKNDRVPSASKSSCKKNKGVKVEEHHRNLPLSKNKKHISSACNNVKLATKNVKSKVVYVMCKQCLISVNHDVCLLNYVNGKTSRAILGFGDLQWGNILITKVYFVEGLGHNLFSVGQFCDSNLEVAFRRNVCFIRNLKGVDLLKGDRSINLYTINLLDMASASPICLMACASSTKSWLWHQRLSHLNFDTINDLARHDLVSGLPKFKYHKEHLFSSCEQEKSKRASYPPKPVPNSRQRLHLLHMDLCGPMRIASINGKRVGISHQVSSVRTPQQNGVVERINQTLVEAARNMLIFSRVPLFLSAKAIATACFTQNRSIIHRRFNKTPYKLINGKKPDISFLHVFGALCYPKNDREDIGNLGAKVDIGFFIGYSANSCAFRVYNRSKENHGDYECELDLLFEAMYDDYIGGQQQATQRTVLAAQAQQVRTQASLQPKTIADNVPNAMFDANSFLNPFASSSTSVAESSSSQYVDPSNMHTFYQPYPHEFQWTKNHPLEQVIGEPSRAVLTSNQLRSDGDMCIYTLSVSTMEPKNVKEAMTDPAWIESMQEELIQFKRMDVWVLVPALDNISPLTLKWIFKNKHDEEQTVIRNKSRQVVRGYRQDEGLGFRRILCSGTIDPTLFIRRFDNHILVVQVYVDDIIFDSSHPRYTQLFFDLMKSRFEMSMMGEMTFFLGLQVNQSPCGIFINQSKYVLEILKKYGMESYDPIGTPMEIKDEVDLDQNGTPVDVTKYRSIIGALMYLTSSRLDIVHATCLCAQYQAKPIEKHLKEVKRIFRYLRGTVNTGLWYTKDSGFELTGFSDADYAGCKDTFKSASGGAHFLREKLVSWPSKKQNCTALSTTKAEYVSLSACCAQVLWMRTQLTDYGFHFKKIPIYCDSKSSIAISCNQIQHSRTKHIAVRYYFIKEHVKKGTIEMHFVKTDYQLATYSPKLFQQIDSTIWFVTLDLTTALQPHSSGVKI